MKQRASSQARLEGTSARVLRSDWLFLVAASNAVFPQCGTSASPDNLMLCQVSDRAKLFLSLVLLGPSLLGIFERRNRAVQAHGTFCPPYGFSLPLTT